MARNPLGSVHRGLNPLDVVCVFPCCGAVCFANSATRTRCRVAAEYPNQLDYSLLCVNYTMLCGLYGMPAIFAFITNGCLAQMTPAGLEPAIPCSVGRCLINWATGPLFRAAPRSEVSSCYLRLFSSCRLAVRDLLLVACWWCVAALGLQLCASIARLVRA